MKQNIQPTISNLKIVRVVLSSNPTIVKPVDLIVTSEHFSKFYLTGYTSV
jgi:hypothetical protein